MRIVLVNAALHVFVRPDLGGRIDQIEDVATGKDWLWHSPEHREEETRTVPAGASFDEFWSGGWEEVFPNDAAGRFDGRDLVDHGELWSQPWRVVEYGDRGAKLALVLRTVPVEVEKTIVLDEREPRMKVTYALRNLSESTVPFLLKMHPAIAIEPGDSIELPACDVEPVDLGFSRIIGRAGATRFPHALSWDGGQVRLDLMADHDGSTREFFYCSALEHGECSVLSARTGSRLRFRFSLEQFPYVWVFQSFGGFGGHYVLILEPCTTKPYDLTRAWEQGTTPALAPLERRELTMEVDVSKRVE